MKKNIVIQAPLLAAAFLCVFALSENVAMAQMRSGGEPPPGGRGGRQGVGMIGMTVATTACTGKSEKDTCSFSSSESVTVSGTCIKLPARGTSTENTLACMPARKDGENKGEMGNKEERASMSTLERAQAMKTTKKAQIYRIESRVKKMIAFLDDKGADDTTLATINGYEDVFEDKADTLLEKFDAYIALLEDTDASDTDKATALTAIKTASKDMTDYFTGTLRASMKTALENVAD